ncbi:mediator of RNA polymerase II transcription subunit 15a-like isoform X2 [Pistacia vera]|uniref:mediator of RNA polymerase II transcription subunit 15a-like isoform X2 n=1 Tax=Pistacia vera TaxID=55513 RepID=UPI001262E0DF|nr:mediator of RNA polymerase II transcription subunit 15a-like isoform X2 [Pistacia vera]
MRENKQSMTGKSVKPFSLNENSKKIIKRTPPTAHHDQKRSLNGLTMELRSQNAAAIFLQSSNTGNSNRLRGPDCTAHTGHSKRGDWKEEVYQKIKAMKEMYLLELNETYQKISAKLQQHDSHPQQLKWEQVEKLEIFKTILERIITFLQVSKSNISPDYREKLGSYEKQIINFINANRPRKPVSSLQPGQLPPPHRHSMQQPQSQLTQVQPHDNQMNPQIQSMNSQA